MYTMLNNFASESEALRSITTVMISSQTICETQSITEYKLLVYQQQKILRIPSKRFFCFTQKLSRDNFPLAVGFFKQTNARCSEFCPMWCKLEAWRCLKIAKWRRSLYLSGTAMQAING